jgi:hypothetical protein
LKEILTPYMEQGVPPGQTEIERPADDEIEE